MKLKPVSLGVAFGLVWGLALFITSLVSVYTGYAKPFLDVIASIYPGYGVTLAGSAVGLLYGFVDGFVWGALVAWIYNRAAGG